LFSGIGSTSQITIKPIVEARAVVVVIMEELGVEWDRISIPG
jgi:hypothetical protein